MWLLGSSDQSALMAAQFGLAFSFAHFIADQGGDIVLQAYRNQFRPSDFYDAPEASLCVFMVCAETEQKARELALCRDLVLLLREKGRQGPFPSIEETRAYDFADTDEQIIERNRPRSLYGTPDQCRKTLEELATDYGVDEMVILSICHSPEDRTRSYQLIAEAFR